MTRTIGEELLDRLPVGDPTAVRSRRELRRVNWWMGNARIAAEALRQTGSGCGPRCLVDLGGGDGHFVAALATRRSPGWTGLRVVIVDRNAELDAAAARRVREAGWRLDIVRADALEWARQRGHLREALVLSNLFLHHLTDDGVTALFRELAAEAACFLACEPRRSRFAALGARALALIGCQAVTRHDALVSVRAGFTGTELTQRWPSPGPWTLIERRAGPFSHLFVARRKETDSSRHGR